MSLYADDTCIYNSSKNVSDVKTILENDRNAVSKWLACNKLKLNIAKCGLSRMDGVRGRGGICMGYACMGYVHILSALTGTRTRFDNSLATIPTCKKIHANVISVNVR